MIDAALDWIAHQPTGLLLFMGAIGIMLIVGWLSIRSGGS
jgi:hypothetical protein